MIKKLVLIVCKTYITTLLTWDQSVAMLEAEAAEIPLNITENGGNNTLFYNQHVS
jgi:hypothetical protein